MLAGLEALRHLSRVCHELLPPAALEIMLGHATYGGHATDGLDLNAVKSVANCVATEQIKMVSSSFTCSCIYLLSFTVVCHSSCNDIAVKRIKRSTEYTKRTVSEISLCFGLNRSNVRQGTFSLTSDCS